MEWKNKKGVNTIILSNYSLYEGIDNAEKIRNMIKSYYEKENIQWVLLAGDAQNDLIPIRDVYNPDVIELEGSETLGDRILKPTDYYFADLTGNWDEDKDGNWGESSEKNDNGIDEIDWTPDVYVGRLPASNAEELEIMVNKTLSYEKNPFIGKWMNRMLLAGGISDTIQQEPPDGEDESRLTTYIWQTYAQFTMNFTHLYRSASYVPPDPKKPLTSTNFIEEFNQGYSTVIFAGHGSYNQFSDERGRIYSNTDANIASNVEMPSLIYADACTTASYDYNDISIGELLIKKELSGAIGYIGGLRVNWYLPEDENLEKLNRGNAKLFWEEFFANKKYQPGRALYDSKVSYIHSDYFNNPQISMDLEYQRKQILTYSLLGDPEIDIYTNVPLEISNPVPEKVFNGQFLTMVIKDMYGQIIANARVNIKTNDGKYYTSYSNEEGIADFQLPIQENETYYLTITGHNLVPFYGNLTVVPDNVQPDISNIDWIPKSPSVSDNVYFSVKSYDIHSGVEGVYILISNNDFDKYTYFELLPNELESGNLFECSLKKLDPGEYKFIIISRDYSNNIKIVFDEGFKFTVYTPFMNYILMVGFIISMSFTSISGIIIYNVLKHYFTTLKRLEDRTPS
jgi:hypothetical protein